MSGHSTWLRCGAFRWFLVGLLLVAWTGTAWADDGPKVVRVEEDWELVVGTPDVDSDSPQITCVISPVGGVDSVYAVLELNAQTLPSFSSGGLQLQLWSGEKSLVANNYPNGSVLRTSNETIRWTQSVELTEGNLNFEVTNGSSTTWGSFGGQGYLKASHPTELTSLGSYNPAVSVSNSRVGYAANRVDSLVLKRVRFITSDGQTHESAVELAVSTDQ